MADTPQIPDEAETRARYSYAREGGYPDSVGRCAALFVLGWTPAFAGARGA